jgi:lipopolysaccharide assembly outer membrane protein LptD (OstA)
MWPHEWTARTNYSFNRSMFIDALIQYDPSSDRFNSNVRFNLIHRPLSDIYLVWNEQRVTTGDGTPPGRSLTLKATYMLSL